MTQLLLNYKGQLVKGDCKQKNPAYLRKFAYSSPFPESSCLSELNRVKSGEERAAYLLCNSGCLSNGRTILLPLEKLFWRQN